MKRSSSLRNVWKWIFEPSHRFIPLFLVFLWILLQIFDRIPAAWFHTFLNATTSIDYHLIDFLFEGASRSGTTLALDDFAVQIIEECTGLFEAVILVAAVLAYHATWRERSIGIVLGITILYAMNVLRIAFLLIVGRFANDYFDFAHIYLWQSLLLVFITAIWLLWIRFVVSGPVLALDPDGTKAAVSE